MKVVHILGSLNRGGTENLLLDIFNNTKGAFQIICIHRKKGVLHTDFLDSNIPMRELPLQKHLTISFIHKLRKLFIEENVNIVHCHQPIDALLAYFATIGLKIKTILTLHGHGVKDQWIGYHIRKFTIRQVNTVLFVSNFSKKYYLQKFNLYNKSNFKIQSNGIDLKKFDLKKQVNIRVELKIQKDLLIFGTVGSFSSGRDQMTICRFLTKLLLQRTNFLFLFIGAKSPSEPELFDECISYCKQNNLEKYVKFLGNREDIPLILPNLDAFIYSSVHDTFGIAVIEAMYSGIPVFLNDWEVMKEITENGKHATIYRSKDENDLFQKFNHFLNNKIKYEQKAVFAKKFVEKHYSIQSHIQKLIKVYQSVLKT